MRLTESDLDKNTTYASSVMQDKYAPQKMGDLSDAVSLSLLLFLDAAVYVLYGAQQKKGVAAPDTFNLI